jgi:polyhydroxyalkanoate synthesis regulator phasin
MFKNKKRLLVVVPVAVLAALTVGVAAIAASPSPSPSPSGDNPGQIFVQKLAGILHLSQSQTANDLKQAELQTIDQMVKDGRLTQAQADKIKQRINSGQAPGPFHRFPRGARFGDAAPIGSLRTAELNAVAGALGMSVSDLQTQLRSGKTLADLEQSKGVSDAAVRSAAHDAAKKVLDPAVKAGTITQSQEDAILQRITSGPGLLGPGPRGGFGRRFDHPPTATPTP